MKTSNVVAYVPLLLIFGAFVAIEAAPHRLVSVPFVSDSSILPRVSSSSLSIETVRKNWSAIFKKNYSCVNKMSQFLGRNNYCGTTKEFDCWFRLSFTIKRDWMWRNSRRTPSPLSRLSWGISNSLQILSDCFLKIKIIILLTDDNLEWSSEHLSESRPRYRHVSSCDELKNPLVVYTNEEFTLDIFEGLNL